MNQLVILEVDTAWSEERCESALTDLPEPIVNRARRYRSDKARQNLVASQVALRQSLVALGENPASLEVCPYGRPFLAGSGFEFNLSHSEQRAVIAMSKDEHLFEALGVDVEWISRRVERDALAKRFFAPPEHNFTLKSAENFFTVWTRKEAVLKTNGLGLRVELDSFQVLENQVAQEITGRPLALGTELRDSGYMTSWAVALDWAPFRVVWVKYGDEDWQTQLRAGIQV